MNCNAIVAGAIRTGPRVLNLHGKTLVMNQRRGFVELPSKKQVEQLKNWIPTLAVFGATSFVAMCYFTDWRVTNEWIPFYSGKFKPDE